MRAGFFRAEGVEIGVAPLPVFAWRHQCAAEAMLDAANGRRATIALLEIGRVRVPPSARLASFFANGHVTRYLFLSGSANRPLLLCHLLAVTRRPASEGGARYVLQFVSVVNFTCLDLQ